MTGGSSCHTDSSHGGSGDYSGHTFHAPTPPPARSLPVSEEGGRRGLNPTPSTGTVSRALTLQPSEVSTPKGLRLTWTPVRGTHTDHLSPRSLQWKLLRPRPHPFPDRSPRCQSRVVSTLVLGTEGRGSGHHKDEVRPRLSPSTVATVPTPPPPPPSITTTPVSFLPKKPVIR